MRIISVLASLFVLLNLNAQPIQSGHQINIEINKYENDTMLIGYYYGNRQLVHDTLFSSNGSFTLSGPKKLDPGMYLGIIKPDNAFFQFLVPATDQHFDIKTSTEAIQDCEFEGSKDNNLFLDYIEFIQKLNNKAGTINQEKGKSLSEEESKKKLESLNKEVIAYQNKIIDKYPESLTSKLIRVNKEIEIPPFEGVAEEINQKRYHYYKEHYFDYLQLNDDDYSRLPYTFQKIENYIDKFTPQHPDSIIKAIDFILDAMEEGSSFHTFYLSHFLNKYAKSKIVGMDAIYVHLVDNYYSKGKASWIDEETLLKLQDNASMLRPTLIGKKAADVITFKEDGSTVNLYSVDAEYTILYIYAYDCGHCKKSTPPLVSFIEENKDQDIKVFTICTKREIDKCWEYTREKNMEGFINTVDPGNSSRFKQKFDVRQTPKIYILNKDKEILLKGFDVAELDRIMGEIRALDNEKS